MSIQSELTRITNAKTAIKDAIEAKGVTVGTGDISTYAAKIAEISGGGDAGMGAGDITVSFYDYEGTPIKSVRCNKGDTVTPPTPPVHDRLTFMEWSSNTSLENIQMDAVVGAIYQPTSGFTEFHYTVYDETLNQPTIAFTNTAGNSGKVVWGDGQETTFSGTGDKYLSPTNPIAIGSYILTIEVSGAHSLYQTSSMKFFGSADYNKLIDRIYFSPSAVINTNSVFNSCTALTHIVIPYGITALGTYAYNYNGFIAMPSSVTSVGVNWCQYSLLTGIILPKNLTTIPSAFATNSKALYVVAMPEALTTISANAFFNCSCLRKISFGANLTTIGASAFSGCAQLKEVDMTLLNSVPTLSNANAFPSTNTRLVFKVKSSLLNDFKTSTNWATFASQFIGV